MGASYQSVHFCEKRNTNCNNMLQPFAQEHMLEFEVQIEPIKYVAITCKKATGEQIYCDVCCVYFNIQGSFIYSRSYFYLHP